MQPFYRYFIPLVVLAVPCAVIAQSHAVLAGRVQPLLLSSSARSAVLPDAPAPDQTSADNPQIKSKLLKQPKRILGIIPNYRAVSAGTIPPPPTPREAFNIATQNSFDSSSYLFVGLTSMIAEGEDSHPSLGKGVPGFWAYSWRGFIDKTDGNYWVIFILPTVFHEDERYFAKGEDSIFKRAVYSFSRVFITPNYHGRNTINASELLGRGIAQGISISYYPGTDTSASEVAEKYGYALMRDAATNTFREFWPDISAHLFHHHSGS